MPVARFQMPDGRIARFEVAEGTTPEQAQALIQAQVGSMPAKGKESSFMDDIKQGAMDLGAGLVRGAGSIGATILAPKDIVSDLMDGKGLSLESNRERRAKMDAGLRSLGADTDSLLFKGGKLGGEIAGTAGAGGALANVLGRVPVLASNPLAAKVLESVASSGMRTGAPAAATMAGKAADLGVRALGGAISGGLSAGMVNPEDAGVGALIGGAFPVAAAGVGKVSQAAGRALRGGEVSPEVKTLAQRAQTLGIDIPADRIVNSKPMNALAATLDYVPFSGRAATEAQMNSQLNQALSRTFGQDSSNVTQALRRADASLGGKFDTFLQNNTVKVDNQFLTDLADAASQASKELGSDGASIISKQVDEILAKGANGQIDGQAAYNIKKTLDRIGNRNSPEAWYALDLKGKLMDALNRSVGTAKADEFAGLRRQYGSMLSLQKLAKNGAEGEVSAARLANLGNIRNPEIQELADIAAQFVKPREGMHGAAQRAVTGMAVGGFGGLPAMAGMVAGGRMANTVLNSNAARNALIGGTNPQLENALAQVLGASYRVAPVLSAQ